jgi:VIT1/CCC1 family predicted Fe2+/Mn2+ transporter
MTLSMAADGDIPSPATRLGAAVRSVLGVRHRRRRHDAGTNWLYDVILGGQDGLVNILGIVLGVIAGGGSRTVLLATGFAAAITESISMGAVGYTSALSQRDYYRAQRAREEHHVSSHADEERRDLRSLYAGMGFSGELLDQVVDTITANRDTWITTILDQELHVQQVETPRILRSAVVITVATLIGHLIPLLGFVWLPRGPALVLGLALSALALFAVGVYSAVSLIGDWRRNGLQFVAIGLGAAAVGFAVGRLFGATG